MKRFKKILVAISTMFAAFSLFLIFGNNEVKAATNTSSILHISYDIYDEDEYKIKSQFKAVYGFDYATAKSETDTYILRESYGVGYGEKYWSGGFFKASKPSGSYATLGTMPAVTVPAEDPWDPDEVYQGAGYSYAVVKAAVDAYNAVAPITSVKPGQKIVIVPKATIDSGTGIMQVSITVDVTPFYDSSSAITYDKSTVAKSAGNYPNNETLAGAGHPNVGFTYTNKLDANIPTGSDVEVGAIHLKLSDTLTSFHLEIYRTGTTAVGFTDNSGNGQTYKGNAAQFDDPGLNMTVTAAQAPTAAITALKLNNVDIMSTDDGNGKFTPSAISGSTATIVVTPQAGTVTSATYATTESASGTAAAINANSMTIPMSSVTVGGNMYVKFTVASSGTPQVTKTYTVVVATAKSTNNLLDGMSIVSDGAQTTANWYSNSACTTTTSFSSSTDEYWIVVDSSCTNVNFTPSLNPEGSSIVKTATMTSVSGNITSGTQYSVSKTQSLVEVEVTPQDTTAAKKKYKFHIVPKSTDTSVTQSTISITAGTGSNAVTLTGTYNPTTKTYTFTGLPFSTSPTQITVTSALTSGQTAKFGSSTLVNGTPVNATVAGASSSTGTTATSNPFTLTVASPYGNQENYNVDVQMDPPATDTTVSKVIVYYTDPNGGAASHDITSSIVGNKYTLGSVPWVVNDFTIEIQLPNGAKQTIGYNTTSLTSMASNTSLPAGQPSSSIAFSATPTVNQIIKSVFVRVTAQNTNHTNDFEIAVTRDGASSDNKFTSISVQDNLGNELGTWNSASQTYTVTGSPVAHSITAITVTATASHAYAKSTVTYQLVGGASSTGDGQNASDPKLATQTANFTNPLLTAAEETLNFVVTCTSQSNVPNTVNIQVKRKASDDNFDYTLVAIDNAGNDVTSKFDISSDFKSVTTKTGQKFANGSISSVKFYLTPQTTNVVGGVKTTSYWNGTTNVTDDGNKTVCYEIATTGFTVAHTYDGKVLAHTEFDTAGTTHEIKFYIDVDGANDTYAYTLKVYKDSALTQDVTSQFDLTNPNNVVTLASQRFAYGVTDLYVVYTPTSANPNTKYVIGGSDYTSTPYHISMPASDKVQKDYLVTVSAQTAANQSGYTIKFTATREAANDLYDYDLKVFTDSAMTNDVTSSFDVSNKDNVVTFAANKFENSVSDLYFMFTPKSTNPDATYAIGSVDYTSGSTTKLYHFTMPASDVTARTYPITVSAVSLRGTSHTVMINVDRKAANDTFEYDLHVYTDPGLGAADEVTSSFNVSSNYQQITTKTGSEFDYSLNNLYFVFIPKSTNPNTTFAVGGIDYTSSALIPNAYVLTMPASDVAAKNYQFTVVATTKMNAPHNISVTVARKQADDTYDYTLTLNAFDSTNTSGYDALSKVNISSDYKFVTTSTVFSNDTDKVFVKFTPAKSTTTYWFGTTDITSTGYTWTLDPSNVYTAAHNFDLTFEIHTAYSNTGRVKVTISRGAADSSLDYSIAVEEIDENSNNTDISAQMATSADFQTSNTVSSYKMPFETKKAFIKLTPVKATTTYWYDGVDITSTGFTVDLDTTGTITNQKTFEFTVTAKTAANQAGVSVKIKLTRAAAEDNTTMNYQVVDASGNTYTGTPDVGDATVQTYTIPQLIAGTTYLVTVSGVSSKSKVYTSTSASNLTAQDYGASDTHLIGTDLYLTVESQAGTKVTYTIKTKYTDTRDPNNKINEIIAAATGASSYTFASNTDDYAITVPFTTTDVTFTVRLDSSNAIVNSGTATYNYQSITLSSEGLKPLSVGDNYFYFQAKALNESLSTVYRFKITRQSGSTADYLTGMTINGEDCFATSTNGTFSTPMTQYTNNGFDYCLPRTAATSQTPTIVFTVSANAKFKAQVVSVASTLSGFNPTAYRPTVQTGSYITVQVDVWSEEQANTVGGGTPNTYTFNIYVASQDYSLSSVNLLKTAGGAKIKDTSNADFAFNASLTAQPTFTVAYSVDTAFIEVKTSKSTTNVSGQINLQNLSQGSNPFTFTVKSEYAMLNSNITDQEETYTIDIYRSNPSGENKLSDLVLKDTNGNVLPFDVTFNELNNTYNYVVPTGTSLSKVNVSYTKKDSTETVSIPGATAGGDFTFTKLASQNAETISVYVQSEDPTIAQNEYKIIVSNQPITYDTDNTINSITATFSDTTDHLTPVFSSSTQSYSVSLSGSVASVNINIVTTSSTATIWNLQTKLNGTTIAAPTAGNANFTKIGTNAAVFNVALNPGESKVFVVSAKAEDPSTGFGSNYTITVSRAVLDQDATLSDLQVNGVTISGFAPTQEEYTVYLPHSTQDITLAGTPNSTAASITANDAPTATALTDGEKTFTITCTSEDPTKSITYKVKVIRDAEKTLDDLEVNDATSNLISYVAGTTNYTVTPNVPFETNQVTVVYTTTATSGVTVEIEYTDASGTLRKLTTNNAIVPLNVGLNTIKVVVYTASAKNANSGEIGTYTVDITRDAGNSLAFIDSYTTEDGVALTLSQSQFTYDYVVPRGTTIFNPTVTYSQNSTQVVPTNNTLNPGVKNEKKITVTSQDGSVTNIYTFNVYVADSNPNDPSDPTTPYLITDINVLDKAVGGTDIMSFDPVTGTYTTNFVNYAGNVLPYSIVVPYSVSTAFLQVVPNKNTTAIKMSKTSNVIGDSSFVSYADALQSLNVGANTFYVYAVSEYGQLNPTATSEYSPVYKITINKEAANSDATLKDLVITYVDDNGVSQTYTATAAELAARLVTIQNIGENVSSINVTATATYQATKVNGMGGTPSVNGVYSATGKLNPLVTNPSGAVSGYNFPFYLETLAEDGSSLHYDIVVTRGPINIDENCSLEFIKVDDSTSKIWLDENATQTGTEVFNSTKYAYTYTIPYGAQTVTIYAQKYIAAASSVFIFETGTSPVKTTTGSKSITITQAMYGTTVTYDVYIKSKDNNNQSQTYQVTLTFEAPSTDATLKTLTADGATVTGFQPTDVTGTYTLTARPNSTKKITIAATVNDATAKAITCNGVAGTSGSFSKQFDLAEGTNQFIITVTAQDGTTQNTYIVNVDREYPLPYLTDLGVIGEALLSATTDKGVKFDQTRDSNTGVANTLEYHVKVTYITSTGVITASVDNPTFTVSCTNSTVLTTGLTSTFAVNLVEGDNPFQIEVRSTDGKTQTYKLIIKRATAAETSTDIDTATIKQVPQFDKDFISTSSHGTKGDGVFGVDNNGASLSDYRVNNNVTKLDVDFRAAQAGATVKVYNDKDLKPGNNEVLVVVTAEDGVTSRVLVVNVYREEMEFEVNKDATTFETVKVDDSTYTIKLGKLRANALTEQDYKDYITWDSKTNDLTVEVLSDINDEDCSEVLLAITDGDEIKYVKLQLDSETIGNTSFFNSSNFKDWFPWALLIIAGILLVIILICVNRDKYGAINKKRKDQE